MVDGYKLDGDGDVVLRMPFGESCTQVLIDELNETLANDTSSISKLVRKYALTSIDDVGYGCCVLEITFHESFDARSDETKEEVKEYLFVMAAESNWQSYYFAITDAQEDVADYVKSREDLDTAITEYIQSIIECGFNDSAEEIREVFASIPEAADIINKQLLMQHLAGKYKGELSE